MKKERKKKSPKILVILVQHKSKKHSKLTTKKHVRKTRFVWKKQSLCLSRVCLLVLSISASAQFQN